MKRRSLTFGLICTLLFSCAPQRKIVSETNQQEDFVCGSYYSRNRPGFREERSYRRESWIGLDLVIKDSDTLTVNELNCVDSMKFTQELNKFEVRDMCVEMGMQGKTYFKATTNKYGGFEEISVARSVDHCFHDLEEKIKKKVLTMRIVPEDAGTYEIIFYHILRLH